MSSPTTTEAPNGAQPAEAATQPAPALATTKPERAPVTFDPNNPVQLYMDSGVFGQLQRVSNLMCRSGLVPAHLRGEDKLSDCFLVAAQAFRWGMDPFSVAQHTFVLSGKLGYEGKLIAALVNASGKLVANLKPVYSGEGLKRKVVIVGRLKGESEDRTVDGTVADWQTQNEKWKSMPDQMLMYRGSREWARRHMPEVMLGIQADEEVVQIIETKRDHAGTVVVVTPDSIQAGTATGVNNATEPQRTPAPDPAPSDPSKPAPAEREPGSDDGDDAPGKAAITNGMTPAGDALPKASGPFGKAVEEQQKKKGAQKGFGE